MKLANKHSSIGPSGKLNLLGVFAELALCLCAGIVFGLLAFGAIELTRGDGRIAMVWVPNAVAVAALLRWRFKRQWPLFPAIWTGNICANLAAGDALATALTLSASNAIEILLAVTLVRRFVGDQPDMRDIKSLLGFVLLAGVLAPAASATFAMTALGNSDESIISGWLKWMVTDGLGMILFAPSLLIFHDSIKDARRPSPREIAEWSILMVFGTAITLAVFLQTDYPLLFLIYPVVLSHAFRLGSLGTAASIFKIGIIAMASTLIGVGPIHLANGSAEQGLVVLQAFLASAFLVGLPVAALLNRQKTMLAQIAERQAQLTLLTDNMADAVLSYSPDGTCTYASPSASEVFGAPCEELIGSKDTMRANSVSQDVLSGVSERLSSGATDVERFTYRRLRDDDEGNAVFIEAFCHLVRDPESGKSQAAIVSARDVTERIELEKQLVRARRHAENAAFAKSQFLANMSHEIRTPMNGVLGFVELLLQADLPAEQRGHAELVQESGNSMMRLLNDILDLSKIEAGQLEVHEEPVRLAHLLSNCRSLHLANAAQKNIELVIETATDMPFSVVTDGLRLRQIILNLLGNAVKFTREGSIALTSRIQDNVIVITVEDSGIGIGKDRLDAIFQPFEQADNTTSRQYGGTGLGLSISRHLAERLGGTLTAASEPGKGSRFELRIPLVFAEAEIAPATDEHAHCTPLILIPGSRVLLAEDRDINRILVRAMLEKCGIDVGMAEDGQQAVAAVMDAKAKGMPFQLVLMDIQMPECDGYTATRTIRELGLEAEELPIVALTANAFEDDRLAARIAGMQGHLAKPLQFSALVEELQRWLPTTSGTKPAASKQAGVSAAEEFGDRSLEAKWQARRSEALAAVSDAIRENRLEGSTVSDLARTVHKLAGTAGMFGEDALGEKAGAFERALKSSATADTRRQLAQELLNAA